MTSSSDRAKEAIRHLLDAGSSLSKMSRRELEETARTVVRNATPTKEKIEDAIEELRAQSRRGADFVSDMVQSELKREFDSAARKRRAELADLFERVAGVFGEMRERGEGTAANGNGPTAETPKKAAPKKAAPKKAAPKKSSPKKAAPKKAATKRPAKKATAANKATAAKRATVAKKTTPRKVGAKKVAAKKATARRSTPSRGSTGR
jgi:hypothetical protein